jgi:hypothetical protein
MRASLLIVILLAINSTAWGQTAVLSGSFDAYAVGVIKNPIENAYRGIYLGDGLILTAAHVTGWMTRVVIAGRTLPTKVVKRGSLEADNVDLALLSVDPGELPVSLGLRRNPICQIPPVVGEPVTVVWPGGSGTTDILSPLRIPPQYRARFTTLTSELLGWSGAGVFRPDHHCLLGIVSRRILKIPLASRYRNLRAPLDYAGYFVPSSQIRSFMPSQYRILSSSTEAPVFLPAVVPAPK